ncbi:amidase family protein [Winogradskyella alexanderae]|uniref:Amidase n=1 Tax=Winogradskyella alexanderae TaxID=2877123 RepID=A0ABS7XSM4_9FLAO|nr:amidase family protein [Winogradskyella alexanderae]MCA0132036.1 amidase [Winogradskyella alexanderae]
MKKSTMRITILFLFLFAFTSCKNDKNSDQSKTEASQVNDNSESKEEDLDLKAISTKDFTEFKVLDSKIITKKEIWESINPQLEDFSEENYDRLKPLILEQDIPSLQKHIYEGKFNYEELTKFYLYRIRKYNRENPLSLNSVISVNPKAIEKAKQLDNEKSLKAHPIYGMPILLKDNINASGMATTAGAVALQDNLTEDAFIVEKLKDKGAIILGKANLSEWAYFFCGDCPSGYSAIGGQTLNPYGRRIFDTGGSSSGSGVSVSVNFAAVTLGSETSGSILSPASQNSAVGLKPTIGLVSRSGIVPISSTLDTAGPITRTVIDNAIVLDAIFGEDKADGKSFMMMWEPGFYTKNLTEGSIEGKRFGAPKRLMEDTLFVNALEVLKAQGAEIVEIEEEELGLPNFLRLLNLDMKKDLPAYMENYANTDIELRTVADMMAFNLKDSANTMPYGQKLFKGIVEDEGDAIFLEKIIDTLQTNGKQYFDVPMEEHNLDGFLSINNYHAGFAAVAEYPAITVPMGYTEEGKPKGLTFIGKRLQEKLLLEWAYIYEQASKARKAPENYN